MVIRTDIQVGDDTRPSFSVSLWGKRMASLVSAGDIILLQNVKITAFANVIEAKTVQFSSILPLVHPFESLFSKGMDHLLGSCRVGKTVKDKLKKVIEWVLKSGFVQHVGLNGHQTRAPRNWKLVEGQAPRKCCTVSEVSHLASSCTTRFQASVGEIFLPGPWYEFDMERMFISRRLVNQRDGLVEDMICIGCQLCGSPLGSESASEEKGGPLYCEKSSNHLHSVGSIYRPFMLYVWDDSEYIFLAVTNRASQILFADIAAEKVSQSYKIQKDRQNVDGHLGAHPCCAKAAVKETLSSCSLLADDHLEGNGNSNNNDEPNFYLVWLILLKMLLQHKNSPLEFEVCVSPSKEMEDGRFKMISVTMPCFC